MKRKILAILVSLAAVTTFGLVSAPATQAGGYPNIICWVNGQGPFFTDGSQNFIQGKATSDCRAGTNQRGLLVLKKNGVTQWGSSSGWQSFGSYMSIKTIPLYCGGSQYSSWKLELSHTYNGGPIHYHDLGSSSKYCG